MKQIIALTLTVALLTTGCASAGRTPITATAFQPSATDVKAMADYAQRLPAGSRVRVERLDGRVLHGTLMRAGETALVVQKNTRVPEAPVEVPTAEIARVTVEGNGGGSTAKAVAIGIASGVGAFFALMLIAVAAND
jgi:hypothetical protein